MRFVITGEWTRNRLLQRIVVLYAIYVGGLWVTNAMLYFSKMSLSYGSVVEYYLGSEERFSRPAATRGCSRWRTSISSRWGCCCSCSRT